ncbi:MAG: hypothetical protein ACKPKO_17740, partial [Candidatus Fonsibacter sp.]
LHGYLVGGVAFDSHAMLQAILRRTGFNMDHRSRVVQGIYYMMTRGKYEKEVSTVIIRGAFAQARRA